METRVQHEVFFAGSHAQDALDDLKKVTMDFNDGAQKRLEVVEQKLECELITCAIITASQHKVRMKLVNQNIAILNAHFPTTNSGQQQVSMSPIGWSIMPSCTTRLTLSPISTISCLSCGIIILCKPRHQIAHLTTPYLFFSIT
ncbi:MAG: hypothetical protein AB2689_25750 [Candidatus Thiodiazotropha taylori]|nr:hypothetical protein [Candidatus Thiodiazotropha taylori]MCW4315767.1 hypothetical protein [Candidatus Thiodiazotropha taylori]